MDALRAVFGPDSPHLTMAQMSLRAVLIFFVGVALIRFSCRRSFSRASALDIVITIVVGSNLSRALTGSAELWPAIVATAVMALLYRALAHASRAWPAVSHLLKGNAAILVRDGAPDPKVLNREAITNGDLDEALRAKGVDDLRLVHLAVLERSGEISVLRSGPTDAKPAP